jgi:zinc protease
MILSGAFDYNKEDLIRLDALKEVLQIRMLQRLREDESGVYSPGVRFNAAKYPQGRYSMVINFGCAPQNADKLIASALDEVSKLRQNGPLQENIDKWRAEEKSARETQLKTNSFWIGYLSSRLQNKEDLHQVDQYSSELDKVTVPQLQDAARHYLSGNDYIRLELLPASSQPGTNQ